MPFATVYSLYMHYTGAFWKAIVTALAYLVYYYFYVFIMAGGQSKDGKSLMPYQPPYTITSEIIRLISAISEKLGRLSVSEEPGFLRLLLALYANTAAMKRDELQRVMGLKDRKSFRLVYLKPALNAQLIEMTTPDKLNSRLQQYVLTQRGNRLVSK